MRSLYVSKKIRYGLVILNLSGGENTDESFYWYFRFYKASKV